MKRFPKYHPPTHDIYVEVPRGHDYHVFQDPNQRIGKKDRRLWGAYMAPVPYAYEDPFLRQAGDIQYTATQDNMVKYPYLKPWEDLGRAPMYYPAPFGSANMMDNFGEDGERKGIGKFLSKARERREQRKAEGKPSLFQKAKERREQRKAEGKQGFVAKWRDKRAARKGESGEGRGKLLEGLRGRVDNIVASADSLPEPAEYSNLFAQVAENEKMNIMESMQRGQAVPIMMSPEDMELSARSADLESSETALAKQKKTNRNLIIAGAATFFAFTMTLGYLLIKPSGK